MESYVETIYILKHNMEIKLNSYKTYKDKGLRVVIWMILAYCFMLFPLLRGEAKWQGAESETETAWTAELREPGKLVEDELWLHQEMPPVEKDTPHERFKEMSLAYNLDPSTIWKAEDYYWLTEWMILCIAIAETSWGTKWAWYGNIWNVGNNDRWQRVSYAFLETALEKIWMTLTNQNLGRKQTLGCLSNAWNCIETYDNGKRYATSDGNRERNMTACLAKIYWRINPQTFNIRQR